MHYVIVFFCGMLLCNAVPHVVCGLQGKPFPTPFAKPAGIGLSSPVVNFVWGFANFAVALILLAHQPFTIASSGDLGAFLIGNLVIGVFCARHFGRAQAARERRDA